MPRYGATMEEGMIGEWLVAEGATVAEGDPICSIEIEKLTNEVTAPVAGVLRKILLAAGENAPCGTPIGVLAAATEDISALVGGTSGNGVSPASPSAERGQNPATVTAQGQTPAKTSAVRITVPTGPRPITPKAVRLAEELGVDWSRVAGSGRLGMITREDVRSAAGTTTVAVVSAGGLAKIAPTAVAAPGKASSMMAGAPSAAKGAAPVGGQLSGARRVIASRMMESLQQTAQASIWMDADVTELMNLYRAVRKDWQSQGVRLSVTALIVKALAPALRDHPVCRSRIASDGTIQVAQNIDIAVAVDAPSGLLVPVLRGVDRKPVRQLALELTELSERARIGALGPDEMAGHTMTVSNLGMYGVTYLRPVLNLPESVILGVGASELRPVYRDGGLFPREILPLSLTFDHRLVDGGPAAAFLRDVCRALSPALIEEGRS